MKEFLQQVAHAYCANESKYLIDYCFIFPNKRSGTFFTHFIEEEMGMQTFILPVITSMSDFVDSFSSLLPASRYEQLFTLYNCYSKLSQDITDFDRFLFWGEMLLNDFNDVDSYLVDPEQLFVNVKRLKEISANYLTPEQIEIIKRYWGEIPPNYNPDVFWRHLDKETSDGQTSEQFRKLWEVLYPLYTDFI
ncbi:MAG: hypothetical protein J1E63_10185 [Muribaculaceae bacterium]|nr:hypothetical protein [Muribaculaceae bacterium]